MRYGKDLIKVSETFFKRLKYFEPFDMRAYMSALLEMLAHQKTPSCIFPVFKMFLTPETSLVPLIGNHCIWMEKVKPTQTMQT